MVRASLVVSETGIVAIGNAEYIGERVEGPVPTDDTAAAWVAVNGQYAGAVRIHPRLRPRITEMIERLRSTLRVRLSTGDSDRDAGLFAPLFGSDAMSFDQSPEEKVVTLEQTRSDGGRTLMVGDGLNDAAAMGAADASVAVTDGTSTLVPACDVVMPADELRNLPRVLGYATTMTNVIKASLIFTVFYNILGLTLALIGVLTPVITAILMPLSSLIVIAISVVGARYYARRNVWG